jgi:hypothetical protein
MSLRVFDTQLGAQGMDDPDYFENEMKEGNI